MNNLQPLNLLTTPNNNTSSSGEGQQQFANNSNNNVDQQTRQMALASLFSSLSSLASQQQPQPAPASQQNYHHLYNQQLIKQPPISSRTSPIMDTANPTFTPQTQLQQHRLQQPVAHATPTATSCNPISLSNSLQSVVAAAMMQQQLAATSQQQQPAAGNPFLQAGAEQAASLFGPRHFDQSEPMHQMSQQHHQYQQQQQLHPQSAQPQQRINYCTICNKELCNKYFMKTHMLKMHGINLEVEQPDGSDTTSRSSSGDDRERQGQATGENGDDDGDDDDDVDASKRVQVKKEQPAEESRYPGDWPSTGGGGGKRKTSTGALKKSSSAQDSGASRKLSSGSGQQQKQAATSVMNGFAGNSMGGVVCDICNKELCSKYFLKVHKQNTHGIMTDYQDPNQFIYPFAAATNPFLVQPVGGPPPPAPAGALPFPPNPMGLFAPGGMHQPQQVEQPPAKKAKKARLSGNKINSIDKGDSFVAAQQPSAANDKQQQQFESVYRLLLAKQQQQPQHPPPPPPPIAFDPAAMGAATNPLSALMCFGAMGPATMGPFGPAAGLSAAMVVDNILRNQHLFHRATNQQQQQKSNGCTDSNKQSTSQNGKVSAGKEHSGGGGGSSRYFSHYTEACPMCERRFKSIKWLKTHMMNDHKQEIGAYMQMMMQYVYTSKSQQQQQQHQMMAASNIFEQQQMAQHLMASRSQQAAACGGHLATQVPQFNQLQQQQQQPQSQPRPTSLLSGKCAGGPTRAHANNLFQSQAQQPQQASVMMTNHEQQHQQLIGRGLSSQHPAQRHPALIMSHSSPLNSPMPTTTTSACHQLLNQRPNSNNNGADCDDDDAPQQAALDARCRRDTSLSPGAAINHDDADDLNHNTSPFRRAASGSPQSPLNRALLSGALSLAATRQSPASFATMSCLELDCNLSDGNNNTNNRAEGFSLLASDVHRSWDAISGCSSDDDDEDCERTERQVRDELLQPKQKQQQQQRQIRSGD